MTLEEGLRAQVAALAASTKEDERRIEHYRSVLCTIQEQECRHCEAPEIAGGALHYFSDGCAHGWRNATNEMESLRAQVAALREALERCKGYVSGVGNEDGYVVRAALSDTARAAAEHDERVRREALEEAAKVAQTYRHLWGATVDGSQDPGPTIADAIRALAAKPKDGES